MKLVYTVSQEKRSGLWYAHMIGFSYIPVHSWRGVFGTKKQALKIAAEKQGLPYEDYMRLRRKGAKK